MDNEGEVDRIYGTVILKDFQQRFAFSDVTGKILAAITTATDKNETETLESLMDDDVLEMTQKADIMEYNRGDTAPISQQITNPSIAGQVEGSGMKRRTRPGELKNTRKQKKQKITFRIM